MTEPEYAESKARITELVKNHTTRICLMCGDVKPIRQFPVRDGKHSPFCATCWGTP